MIFIVIAAAIAVILCAVAFVNRRLSAKALAALEVPGKLIKAENGSVIHAYVEGEGKYTLVMLSGWGTACPYADFKPFADMMSKHCRVMILELPGYGFAKDTDAPRNLENYDIEISAALNYFGIKENVILMPHSYSGIATFDYSKKHPDVVCALFNDDCSVPPYYYYLHIAKPASFTARVECFLARNFGRTLLAGVVKKITAGEIQEPYRDMYTTFSQARLGNRTVMAESDHFDDVIRPTLWEKYDEDLHVVSLIAPDKKDFDPKFLKTIGMTWLEMHEIMVSNPKIQRCVVIEGSNHYIHQSHAAEMEKLAVELLEELG